MVTRGGSGGVAALFVAVLLAVAGCTGGGPAVDLPPAAGLLSKSADAMRQVKTAAVAIEVDPAVTVVPIRNATGHLTADGQAEGVATLSLLGGPLLEYKLVVTGKTLYFKGPTGGFQKLALERAAIFYDPTAVLNPTKGVAALLSSTEGATTQARETVDGVDSYRVAATFPQDQLRSLVPGVSGPVPGLLWLDVATSRVVKAQLQLPDGQSGAKGGPATVRLSEFDAPVTVTAPS